MGVGQVTAKHAPNAKILCTTTREQLKAFLNIKVAFLFYILNLALQFISRKIFLDYLGSEVLGLNTTSQNLLGFLNLAELGIGSAIAYSLYKPLSTNNTQDINNIVSVQGWMYHQIAWFIIIASCVLMLFFPYIFAKTSLPIWYAYGSFSALLIGSLLSYFFNYRQIVLSADQKEYKITYTTQSIKLSKNHLPNISYQICKRWIYILAYI